MVKNIVRKGFTALVAKQTNIFSAALFIIFTTIFSQILGVLKYRLLVSIFGDSAEAGIFLAAFRIPDFIFQVLVAAAFSSAFIPIFANYISHEKREEANKFASSLVLLSLGLYIGISLLVMIFAHPLVTLIAPGFGDQGLVLMANLTRVILLSQVFFILGTAATAILQSYQHFLIPGVASAMYNAGIIIGLFVFTPFFGIFGAAIGVLVGSFLFFLIQIPLLRRVGFQFTPFLDIGSGVKKVIKLMIPRSLMFLIIQLAGLANLFFASFVYPAERNYLIFELAQTLVAGPVILFGQSIAQASFPALALKSEDKEQFASIFVSSFNQIVYLTLPISALLVVLRVPVVRLFYGASRFDWQATVDTGLTVSVLSISIAAQALTFLIYRAFYAFKDTQTPFIVTIIAVLVNIVCSAIFILGYHLPIYYLALSFSVSSIFGMVALVYLIDKKIPLPKFIIVWSVAKISIASFVMGVALYIPIKLLDQLVFDTTRTINLIILTSIASAIGFAAYIFFTWLLDIREAYYVVAVIRKFGNRNKILKQVGELITGFKINP